MANRLSSNRIYCFKYILWSLLCFLTGYILRDIASSNTYSLIVGTQKTVGKQYESLRVGVQSAFGTTNGNIINIQTVKVPQKGSDNRISTNFSLGVTNPVCRSAPNNGPIRRTTHLVEATSKTSSCRVVGEGLRSGSVGEIATITIKVDSKRRNGFHKHFFFSVLAISDKHIFSVSPYQVDMKKLTVIYKFKPSKPGKYDLYVEEITANAQKQLPGSPFKLVIDGAPIDEEAVRKTADELPSCQTLPQRNISWLEGEWVTKDHAGTNRGALRSGWVLQPQRCSFDIFTTEDLQRAAASPTPKTIVVLGKSTERAIILSMIDIALRQGEKTNLKASLMWICWGYMEVRLGNLRFIYQDFRIEGASEGSIKDNQFVNITCHNEKIASKNNDFFGDAIGFFQETLFTEQVWPDVVLLVMKNINQLKYLVEAIPKSWNGVIYPLNGFKSHVGSLYTPDGRRSDVEEATKFISLDHRIRLLDGFALASPMRHTTDKSPMIMNTMHWHRYCNEEALDIRVCSDATEMVAQVLLAQALAPNGKDAWLASLEKCTVIDTTRPREIQVCLDCAASLIPWHIKRNPNIKCYNTSTGFHPRDTNEMQVWDGSLCPDKCMESDPVEQFATQSGRVDVRICTIAKSYDSL